MKAMLKEGAGLSNGLLCTLAVIAGVSVANLYYNQPLLDMLRQAVDENFMRVQHGAIWHVAQTPQEAVELIYTTPLWDASIRKFAAI